MNDMIDVYLANIWNHTTGDGGRAVPENMWPLCRLLSDAELILPNLEAVALLHIGPFRLAIVPDKQELVTAFLEGAVPAVVRWLCTGLTVLEAVHSVLEIAFKLFVSLGATSVGIKSPTAWCVLVQLKQDNRNQSFPTAHILAEELLDEIDTPEDVLQRCEIIIKAIEELKGMEALIDNRLIKLISADSSGALTCNA